MRIPFSIEPLCLKNKDYGKNDHRMVLKRWRNNGFLVLTSEEHKKAFLQAVNSLPNNQIGKEWKEMVTQLCRNKMPLLNLGVSLGDQISDVQIKHLMKELDIVAVEPCSAVFQDRDQLGIGLEENFEVALYDDFDQCKVFRKLDKLLRDLINKGETFDKVWKERFESLSRFAKTIVFVDRYLCPWNNKTRRYEDRGFQKVVSRLSRDAHPSSLTIICGDFGTPEYVSNRISHIRTVIKDLVLENNCRGNIIVLSDAKKSRSNDDFKKVFHDRYIRFDDDVVTLGKGLNIFNYSSVPISSDCSLKTFSKTFYELEQNLLAKGDSYPLLSH